MKTAVDDEKPEPGVTNTNMKNQKPSFKNKLKEFLHRKV